MTVEPEEGRPIDHRIVFDFVKKKSLIVCPFSVGQQVIFLDSSCSSGEMSGLGKSTVEYFDSSDFYKEAIKCTPIMGIHSRSFKPQDPVVSYLVFNKSEKFDPVKVRRNDNIFDRSLRQFLNDLGAPVVYYNVMSNVICLSFSPGEKFSLVDAFREFSFPLPATISIESSASSCASWVKERFHASLPEPISGH